MSQNTFWFWNFENSENFATVSKRSYIQGSIRINAHETVRLKINLAEIISLLTVSIC